MLCILIGFIPPCEGIGNRSVGGKNNNKDYASWGGSPKLTVLGAYDTTNLGVATGSLRPDHEQAAHWRNSLRLDDTYETKTQNKNSIIEKLNNSGQLVAMKYTLGNNYSLNPAKDRKRNMHKLGYDQDAHWCNVIKKTKP